MASALGACGGSGSTMPPPGMDMTPPVTVMTQLNYEQALRSAALQLTGNYPTLAEIQQISGVTDPNAQKTAYEALIDTYISRPTFASQMVNFWRDQFKMGGQLPVGATMVDLDYAPTFAASLVVNGQPISNVLTATTGTCQTFNSTNGTFTAATCPNNTNVTGVLSDAGVQAQFYSNMAFRRVRWVQETFACAKFPAETGGMSVMHPGGAYVSPWPFTSITGNNGGTQMPLVDFQSDTSIICANCHTTMNHQAPLFANFSTTGVPMPTVQVMVPVPNTPIAKMTDWLPAGEQLSWRYMVAAKDLPTLAADIVADPVFNTCMATRIWNWVMSRPDVVNDGATLTPDLAMTLTTQLSQNNGNIKELIRSSFKSDDFVHF
jgi:hypothetical protein